jgi:N-acetyl-anhydromuramyl-L-alanine amidase AmpD
MSLRIIDFGKFTTDQKNDKKTQIIITHTSRDVNEYLISLKNRLNGKYNKIPNYVISREGEILQLLSNENYCNFFYDKNINKKSIIISLENLGWLEKEPLKNNYINWIGNIYNGKVFERKWRDFHFWQPYAEVQLENTVKLIEKICEETSIPKKFIGHNTKINGIEKYKGILTRSNYNLLNTDVSPAFDFDFFNKSFNDE